MVRHLKAEFLKLKYPPILWLVGSTVFAITMLIFFAHYMDVESVSAIGKNPWHKLWEATIGLFSVFLNVPFLILLISAAIFLEHHNNAWKYQYAAPIKRRSVLVNKLVSILGMIIITYAILSICIFIIILVLNKIFPETEFSYYPIHFHTFTQSAILTLINSLGIVGIQLFLSLRFKGFLVPAAIGIVAFIVGLIVGVTNTPYAHFMPYAYPLIGQDFNMFTIDKIGIKDYGWLNSIQVYSLVLFVVFIGMSYWSEKKRIV